MSHHKRNAVPGEAPESSDSEEEINTSPEPCQEDIKKSPKSPLSPSLQAPQGIIIAGEAPESDEEVGDFGSVGSVSSAASVSSLTSLTSGLRRAAGMKQTPQTRRTEEIKYKTLLHKKLRERNISLWRNMTELVHSTANQATRELNAADQQLLRSQGVLQETAAQLSLLGTNVQQLREKLDLLAATPFLPYVCVPLPPSEPSVPAC